MRPLRFVAGAGVRFAVAPAEIQRQQNHGDHHQQHQARCDQDQVLGLDADVALGREQGPVAAAQQQGQQGGAGGAGRGAQAGCPGAGQAGPESRVGHVISLG
ncbi:hypothetical protein G6F35_017826 [Rhizopus arrhizus]|nr:hypothetical protein G6F35_017826 [Rhizopus arrhizus]